jgi:hypothetical protein
MKQKKVWLDRAEVIDSLRIFPRLFLLSCFIWAVAVGQQLLNWYITLAKDDRSIEATGFASIVFLGIMAFLKMVYTDYSTAGRAWGPQPAERTSTKIEQTVETK